MNSSLRPLPEAAAPEDAEEVLAAVLEEELPPQAASRPAAPTAPAPLRKLRRVMA